MPYTQEEVDAAITDFVTERVRLGNFSNDPIDTAEELTAMAYSLMAENSSEETRDHQIDTLKAMTDSMRSAELPLRVPQPVPVEGEPQP